MQISAETWRSVSQYEGCYEISSHGRVRSLDRVDRFGRQYTGCLLSPQVVNSGYQVVHLYLEGARRIALVHRLVAEAFLGSAEGHEVDHRDYDKLNNNLGNLRWVTHQDNVRHSAGRAVPQGNRVLAQSVARKGTGYWFPSQTSAERSLLGRLTGIVSWSLKNGRPSHGFAWSRV